MLNWLSILVIYLSKYFSRSSSFNCMFLCLSLCVSASVSQRKAKIGFDLYGGKVIPIQLEGHTIYHYTCLTETNLLVHNMSLYNVYFSKKLGKCIIIFPFSYGSKHNSFHNRFREIYIVQRHTIYQHIPPRKRSQMIYSMSL